MQIVRRGAEAEIRRSEWMGRAVMVKSRVPKEYRHPDLDLSLRSYRTKAEAKLLQEARSYGIPTPIVYDIDLIKAEIWMEEIPGERVKDALIGASPEMIEALCHEIGRLVARLHANGLVHGDLTTSNMIVQGGRIWLIDLSLGGKNAGIEEMGVDLHLLKEAFQSAHSEILYAYDIILASYTGMFDRGPEVVRKIREIEERGRYT